MSLDVLVHVAFDAGLLSLPDAFARLMVVFPGSVRNNIVDKLVDRIGYVLWLVAFANVHWLTLELQMHLHSRVHGEFVTPVSVDANDVWEHSGAGNYDVASRGNMFAVWGLTGGEV